MLFSTFTTATKSQITLQKVKVLAVIKETGMCQCC